jgi:gamma-glutamyl-gamma-aminobutyrate hydrolase PuuD
MVVGILPQMKLKTDDDPYNDKYEFLDLYSKKIIEIGAIPVGILLSNGELDYSFLDICDAFILPGGNKAYKYYYETISYAIKENKPVLGICLGLEAMAIFSDVFEKIDGNDIDEKFFETYKKLKDENDGTLLKKLESPNIHGDIIVNYDNIDAARHEVEIIDKSSILYDIFKKDKLNVVSLHNYNPKWIGKNFKVTAKATDDVIEAIEFNNKDYFILGVHWHPEHDNDNLLFKRLIKEGEKRSDGK